MRFCSQKYTQKPGFWLLQQIFPVQMPISMRQKAIDQGGDATVKLLFVGRYGSEIDGKQQLPAGSISVLHLSSASVPTRVVIQARERGRSHYYKKLFLQN